MLGAIIGDIVGSRFEFNNHRDKDFELFTEDCRVTDDSIMTALDFTIDDIRDSYRFNETCQDTVPQAIEGFLESTSFEDAIRNGISIGGDSDTLAAITGAIAEAYYGVPEEFKAKALSYLDDELLSIFNDWSEFIGNKGIKFNKF